MAVTFRRLGRKILHYFNLTPPVLHVMGDSHCEVFKFLAKNRQEYPLSMSSSFSVVQGATNMGLANPHSKTQAMPIFFRHLHSVRKKDYAIIMLGEVDCGFVIWYRAQKYGISVESQFELSLMNYLILIKKVLARTKKVMVFSTPLPTIPDTDEIPRGEVANKRLEVKATQIERTQLTRRYNERLKEACRAMSIEFIDYESEIIDDESGLVSAKFLNENPLDHHLSNKQFANVIFPKLQRALANLS
jgi:hypothetical protein